METEEYSYFWIDRIKALFDHNENTTCRTTIGTVGKFTYFYTVVK